MSVVLPAPFSPTSATLSPRGMSEVDVPERPRLLARIPEPDVLEHDPGRGAGARAGADAGADAGAGADADADAAWRGSTGSAADRQVLEQVRHVEVVLVDAADRAEHRLERLLPLPERDHVHRHVAERELAGRGQERHHGVRAVERAGADEREHLRPRRPPHVEAAVLVVEVLRQLRGTGRGASGRGRRASPPSRARRSRGRTRGRAAGATRASASCAGETPASRSASRRWSPASSPRTAPRTAQPLNRTSSAAYPASVMTLWTRPKLSVTSEMGRDDASRRARVSLS